LTNLEIVSEDTIDDALGVQKLLRGGQITKKEAIDALIENKERKLTEKEPKISRTRQIPPSQETNALEATIETNKIIPPDSEAALLQQTPENKEPSKPFPKLESLTLHHMLLMAGLVQTDALERAIKEGLKKPEVMGMILKRSEILEDFVIDAAQECCQLIASGQLKPEQAIIALHQCQRTRNSIKDCLEDYGWMEKSEIVW
jgi:hypothetical protein